MHIDIDQETHDITLTAGGYENHDDLYNGERQVGENITQIRRDHVARYEFARDYLKDWEGMAHEDGSPGAVIDVACGVGYGAHLLACAGFDVLATDRSRAAMDYAEQWYDHDNVVYAKQDVAAGIFTSFNGTKYDAAVCFEALEHLADPAPLLRSLREAAPRLIASVPNEVAFPHEGKVAYHYRHYTGQQFEELLNATGWHVTAWYEQAGPESDVEPCESVGDTTVTVALKGQTLIAVCERAETTKPIWTHPTGNAPEHVAIVGLGPSAYGYAESLKGHEPQRPWDEAWTVNTGLRAHPSIDLVFIMDDLSWFGSRYPEYGQDIRDCKVPVITSTPYADYPALAYPLEAVCRAVGVRMAQKFWDNSIPYMLAYAYLIGVKRVTLFGIDYSFPSITRVEAGREITSHWLGWLEGRGMEVDIYDDSSLMQTRERVGHYLYPHYYGYLYQPILRVDSGGGLAVEVQHHRQA